MPLVRLFEVSGCEGFFQLKSRHTTFILTLIAYYSWNMKKHYGEQANAYTVRCATIIFDRVSVALWRRIPNNHSAWQLSVANPANFNASRILSEPQALSSTSAISIRFRVQKYLVYIIHPQRERSFTLFASYIRNKYHRSFVRARTCPTDLREISCGWELPRGRIFQPN